MKAIPDTTLQSGVARIVKYLWDDIAPRPEPGEHVEISTREPPELLTDGLEIHAWRFRPDRPREERHASRTIHLAPLRYRSKSEILDAVRDVLRTLAIILSGKPPKDWRLYNRPKAPPTLRTRLRHAC